MLNITNYQGNANQNHSEVILHTSWNAIIKFNLYITNVSKYVKKLEPLDTVGDNAKWYSHYGKQYKVSSKITNESVLWLTNSISENISKEIQSTDLKE